MTLAYLPPVIARLRAQVPGLRQVAGLAEFGAVAENTVGLPAAFVCFEREHREEADDSFEAPLSGVMRVDLTVMLAVASVRDSRGEAAAQAIEALAGQCRAALAGWSPLAAADAGMDSRCWYDGMAFRGFKDATLWFALDFHFSYVLSID
jgi:hypothetical protein